MGNYVPAEDSCWLLKPLGALLGFVQDGLPDIISERIDALRYYPAWFWMFIGTLLWLWKRKTTLRMHTHENAQKAWRLIWPLGNSDIKSQQKPCDTPTVGASPTRECRSVWASPISILGLILVVVSLYLQSYILTDKPESCTGDEFNTRCYEYTYRDSDQNMVLEANASYLIEVDGAENWFDQCTAATADGFGRMEEVSDPPAGCNESQYESQVAGKDKSLQQVQEELESNWLFSAWGSLRRSPRHNWFKLLGSVGDGPIISIGNGTVISPSHTGELKLFVNDVDMVFMPMGRGFFYLNNSGIAKIKVTRLHQPMTQ